MAKVLCWEERSNGRYCKNYRLNGKTKCRNHYIHEGISIESFLFFVVMSYFIFLGVLYYGDNSDMIDNYIYSMKSFVLEHVKEPVRLGLVSLYKYSSLKY